MNERYNRIAGAVAFAETARKRVDIEAVVLASSMIELDDEGQLLQEVAAIVRPYRAASDMLAEALDELADALRQ